MNKQIKTALKIFVAFSLLAWFFARSDVNKIFEYLKSLPLSVFILALLINIAFIIIKSWRWRLLLPNFSIVNLIGLGFIGQFYSIISAGQIVGEAAKIYIIGKGQNQAGQTTMSVLIDKVSGIIGLLLAALLGIFFTQTALPRSLSLSIISAALLCLILIFLIRLQFIYNYLLKLFNRWPGKSNKNIFSFMARLVEAWHLYSKKMKIIFLSILLSVISQIILVGAYMALSRGLNISISFWDWCWLSGVVGGLTVIPVTIGGLGVREASLVGFLGFFMVAPEKALALSFSFFSLQIILALVGAGLEAKRIKIIN